MLFVRSFLFNVFFYLWFVFILIVSIPLLFLPRFLTRKLAQVIAHGVLFLMRVFVNIKFEVRGKENILPAPAIVASKHQSALDTVYFHILLSDVAFIFKKNLLKIPIYGQFLWKYDMIPIDRKQGKQSLLKMWKLAKKILGDKRYLLIFPEGTRTIPGQPPSYQKGIASLYEHVKVPVIPVALNAGVFWPRRSFLRYPGTIVVEFLDPIMPGLSRVDFMEELTTKIESASNRLIEEARSKQIANAV